MKSPHTQAPTYEFETKQKYLTACHISHNILALHTQIYKRFCASKIPAKLSWQDKERLLKIINIIQGQEMTLPLGDNQQYLTLLFEADHLLLLAVEWGQKQFAFANASHPQDLHNQHSL